MDEADVKHGPVEEDFGKRTLEQFLEFWFTPEYNRRRERGEVDEGFVVYAAQALQDSDGHTLVRFNEEVRGSFRIRVGRPVEKGEPVQMSDWESVEDFELNADELDYGHATIVRLKERWFISFNFLRGRNLAARLVDLSEEYWKAASYCVEHGMVGPAIDNCFSAAELIAKAHLIIHMSPAAKSRTHGPVHSAINDWAKLGNIGQDFIRMFNWLSQRRQAARYSPQSGIDDLPANCLEVIHQEIHWVRRHWQEPAGI